MKGQRSPNKWDKHKKRGLFYRDQTQRVDVDLYIQSLKDEIKSFIIRETPSYIYIMPFSPRKNCIYGYK